jgi:hypothetical protein
MSEEFSQPNPSEVRIPTTEEARNGLYLAPTEAVALDIPTDPRRRTSAHDIGNGVSIHGQQVAEIILGGAETFATGAVIASYDGAVRQDMLVVRGSGSPRVFTARLEQGQKWGIGRRFEGQDMLPDTVSSDHCAIGLDEQGRLLIENHEPTNYTGVRTY